MSKGLEALKTIRRIHDMECGKDESINKDFDIIEKALKALEIIRDRLIVEDKGGYIQVVCEFSIPSKSKEYDLLKEVLL